jgi:hypothetical protein
VCLDEQQQIQILHSLFDQTMAQTHNQGKNANYNTTDAVMPS